MYASEVRKYSPSTLIVAMLLVGSSLRAQNYDDNAKHDEDVGATATEMISGNSTSISGMVKFDTNLGWNFTKHFGFDVGVPYLLNTRPGIIAPTTGKVGYVSEPYVDCTFFFGCYVVEANSPRLWTGELADVYAELHYISGFCGPTGRKLSTAFAPAGA